MFWKQSSTFLLAVTSSLLMTRPANAQPLCFDPPGYFDLCPLSYTHRFTSGPYWIPTMPYPIVPPRKNSSQIRRPEWRPQVGELMENFADGIRPRVIDDPDPFDGLDEIRRRVSVLKASTPGGRARADQLISAGDTYFAEGNYVRAVARYRDAIAKAPDYAESHFRLAHAYVSTRRFNLAIKSAMIALELSGTSRRDGFSLEEMYRGNKFAREQHDALLLDASQREPEDGGLLFLIGFTLHYGGRPLEAREYFRKANQFVGAHQAFTRHYLPVVAVAEVDG